VSYCKVERCNDGDWSSRRLLLVVTPTNTAPAPAPDEPLLFTTACLSDPQNGVPTYWHHCFVNVESGMVVSISWFATYTPQPGASYAGESLTLEGPNARTFLLDQSYQSTLSVDVEVCTPLECQRQHAFFDG
jgi:hypothetical protein